MFDIMTMMAPPLRAFVVIWMLLFSHTQLLTHAYLPTNQLLVKTRKTCRTRQLFSTSSYGRGSEIWPPSAEGPIKLTDSFPNDEIPSPAAEALKNIGTKKKQKPTEWRKLLPRAMARILRRAAQAQEEEAFLNADAPAMDKTPAVVALGLLIRGYIRPLDALLVSFLSGYFCILGVWARSLRRDGVTPNLPALPPQGHVPTLVSNPLGSSFTYSVSYDRWLKLGVLLSFLGPLIQMIRYTLEGQMGAARACARPIFFLCCQAVAEAVSRRVMTPLPLRILIPVSFNTVRLGYLWNWSFLQEPLGTVGRLLAFGNLFYWAINLFGFLLPVAVLRYMRAHFHCVEAEQVITRPGMEESIGLST